MPRYRVVQTRRSRAPGTERFVSGQLFLRDLRANALAHASRSRRTNKAVARAWHRTVCFGPIIPAGFARVRFGACLDIASYKQGGRARLAQDGLFRANYSCGICARTLWRMPRYCVVQTRRSRAPGTERFVSGQLFLWDLRANALAHASILRRTNKAVARAWHRTDWPETNVGAGLPAKRRAGGARSHRRRKPNGIPLTNKPDQPLAWRAFFSLKATHSTAIHAGISITEMRIGGVRYITTRISTMNARHR